MPSILCKLFNMILTAFKLAVEAVGFALQTIGEVLVDVLGAVLSSAAGAIGSIFGASGIGGIIVIGGLIFLGLSVLGNKKSTENVSPNTRNQTVTKRLDSLTPDEESFYA